jgi:pilus assembly protein CpaE
MATASLASGSGKAADDREPFAAFLTDDATIKTLNPVANELGWSTERIQSGGIANAVRSLSVMTSPEFLIVDLSESTDPRADINALAEVCEPGTVVLAVGKENDVGLYRDLINSGIQDYMVKPVTAEILREAISSAQAALQGPAGIEEAASPQAHKVVAIIGARGGVGASTIATSTAWILAHELDRHVAELDLDIHFGTSALTFDLEPGRGLCDALENPGRVDGLFIDRAMIKESEKFSILGAEAPVTEPLNPDPAALAHLLSELKSTFEVVVIDCPRSVVTNNPHLLQEVTDIVIVADLSLAATRDTIRLLSFAQEAAPSANLLLITSKVAPGMNNEVTQKDFETSVERKADWTIPLDTKSALISAKKGKSMPQAAKGSKPVRVCRELAERVAGVTKKDTKAPIWAKFITAKKK